MFWQTYSSVATTTFEVKKTSALPKDPSCPSVVNPSSCHYQPLATTNLIFVRIMLPFPEYLISEIMWYVAFGFWLLSLSQSLWRFICFVAPVSSSFLLSAEQYSSCVDTQFVYAFIVWWTFELLLVFWLLWTKPLKTLTCVCEHMSCVSICFHFFGVKYLRVGLLHHMLSAYWTF